MSYGGFEYGSTTYDEGGYGGGSQGGGFMNDFQGGGFNAGSPGGAGGQSKVNNRERQTIIPVTIKQLVEVSERGEPDDSYKIDGAEMHQVKIVGMIKSVDEKSTMVTYVVEDSTGVFEIKSWQEQNEGEAQRERRMACRENVYVRVIGQLRDFEGRKHVLAHDIRPLDNFNEITYHMLECIFVHLQRTKGPPQKKGGGMGSGMAAAAAPSGGMRQQGMPRHEQGSFNPIQSAVMEFFKEDDQSETGVDVSVVLRALTPQGYSAQQIRETIVYLAGEGHLYTTIDDDHYKHT